MADHDVVSAIRPDPFLIGPAAARRENELLAARAHALIQAAYALPYTHRLERGGHHYAVTLLALEVTEARDALVLTFGPVLLDGKPAHSERGVTFVRPRGTAAELVEGAVSLVAQTAVEA